MLSQPAIPQQVMVRWAQLRAEDSSLKRTMSELVHAIRSPDGLWRNIESAYTASLSSLFSGVCETAAAIENWAPESPSPRLTRWLTWAAELQSGWPVGEQADWAPLILDGTRQENKLIVGCLSRTLSEAIHQFRPIVFPAKQIAELAASDCQWSKGIPLPPEPGCSLHAVDYFHRNQARQLFVELERVSSVLQRISRDVSKLSQDLTNGSKFSEIPANVGAWMAKYSQVTSLARRMVYDVEALTLGWPVTRSRIIDRLDEAFVLVQAIDAMPDQPLCMDSLGATIDQILPQFRLLSETAAALENGSANQKQETTTVDARPDTSNYDPRQPVAAALWTQPRESKSASEQAGAPEALRDRLLRFAASTVPGIRVRLEELVVMAERYRDEQTQATKDEYARALVTCLMLVEKVAVPADQDRDVMSKLHNVLRETLFDSGLDAGYILLDRQLVGQPLRACFDRVHVKGTIPARSLPPDHVAEVTHSGYLFQHGGSQTVLRPADVLIAE